jgi:dephospho-CoA kinase
MKLFGLTGGIGMGKSTAARLFFQMSVPVIDTDEIAREVVKPGQSALAEIKSVFGPEMLASDGQLRRDLLAQRVFSDPEDRLKLEQILHPRIRQIWQMQVEQWRKESRAVGVVVIPLLFETGAASYFDIVACVACTATTQSERLRSRGWTMEQIDQRRRAQWHVDKKMAVADVVIWSEGEFDVLEEQLRRIVDRSR